MFLFIKDVELANLGDENATYPERNDINELFKLLEKGSKSATDLFMNNDMAVNPDKFQAKILSCDKKKINILLNINDGHITSKDSILLGEEIDNKLNFEKHMFQLFVEKKLSN